MNITKFSIQRPIGISMIFMLITVLGLFSYSHIGVELLPDVESPYISCIVEYPGASTESVEQQLTKPIEDAISTLEGVKEIRSVSMTGRSEVFVELSPEQDPNLMSVEATKAFTGTGSQPDVRGSYQTAEQNPQLPAGGY